MDEEQETEAGAASGGFGRRATRVENWLRTSAGRKNVDQPVRGFS